ncbi:MAG TPA: hypothetical protein VFN35_28185, partial [Ktedonobacteraceae bacterium]|nr:hypothetical protein [Ktedonobacteraceae bacterium]
EPRLRSWFYAHPSSHYLHVYQEDIINETFERFYAQHQKKPLKIEKLSEILTYLHRCFYTAIMIWKRMKDKERFTVGTLDDLVDIPAPDPIDRLLGKLSAQEIWQQVVQCTDNACEGRVVYQWLVRGESAPEIVRLLPADKLTSPKVYQITEKVLRRYRKRYPDLSGRDSAEEQDNMGQDAEN